MVLCTGCRGVANGANHNKEGQTTDKVVTPLDFGETMRGDV